MKERILAYLNRIDTVIAEDKEETDWEELLSEHLVQVGFFQHERLVHLLVFILVALLTVACLLTLFFKANLWLLALLFLLIVLLVPYVMHYYLLENSVQKMYEQYDAILEKIRTQHAGN